MRWAAPYYIKAFEEHPGLLDTRDPRGIDKLLDQYAQAAREVAKAEDVDLVDVHEAFGAYGQQPGQSVTDILLAGDGIHPNQAGQDLVCSILTPKIAEMVQPHD